MRLVCLNCGTVYADPGGDVRQYRCRNCGFALQRAQWQEDRSNDPGIGLIAGAGLGAALGGFPGAVAGGIIGLFAGLHRKNQPPQR